MRNQSGKLLTQMLRPVQPETHAGPRAPATCIKLTNKLDAVDETQWNALNISNSPFLDYAFLSELERRNLVSEQTGWRPCHLIATQDERLVAAMPMYEKTNSFGEFVFDWAWAEAFRHLGRPYFPKLVCAVPFTPVPGPRVLASCDEHLSKRMTALIDAARRRAEERQASSLHILFADRNQAQLLGESSLLQRTDCRFLWRNADYPDFDAFLEIFTARQRKKIRHERRAVRESGTRFEWISGDSLQSLDWPLIHALCARTFIEKGHYPYLDSGFFAALARSMPDKLLVNLARQDGEVIAAAIYFRDHNTLYGRYWGTGVQQKFLHFESCYYQGIEYAINNGLSFFDPGTQGEHKLRRGFEPVASHSLHWFRDPQIARAIAGWLNQERELVASYIRDCHATMPFTVPGQPAGKSL